MTARRFEFVEGTSSKFWQIDARGSELHIAWGKIGTAGQSQVKSFASDDAAASEAEKLVKKKVKEGYLEKSGEAAPPAAKPEARPKAAKAKPAKKTDDGPKVDTKIVTLWRKAGKLVDARGYASTFEITNKPGAWEAFAAAVEGGDVSLSAVWKLGEQAMDHVPARGATDLLAARPAQFTDLWHLHSLAIGVMIARLLEDGTAFDALQGEPIPALVEIAKIQAGVAPAGSASAVVREAIASRWTTNMSIANVSVSSGKVTRSPADDDTPKQLGELLLGEKGLTGALADGYRRILAGSGPRPYPNDATLRIAAAALSPEEVTRFHVRYVPLWHIAQKWSVDQLVEAALATKKSGDGGLVAGTAAVLAIGRDPSVAPKLESALQMHDMSHQEAMPPSDFYASLVRTDPTWRRAWLEKTVFGPEVYPSTFSGPMGIALVAASDVAEAERLASKHEENLDYTRIHGVPWQALLEAAQKGGPALKRGLLLPIATAFSQNASTAPEVIDAMITLDGSHRDSWLLGYLLTLPEPRRRAILKRAIEAGNEGAVRTTFAAHSAVIEAMFGASAPAPSAPPREDPLADRAREIEAASARVPGERVAIYLLAEGDDAGDDDIARTLGGAAHVPKAMRPKFQGESMAHVLTIDLDAMPELRVSLGKEGHRAMAFFVSDLDGHAAHEPGGEHAKIVWLTDADLAKAQKEQDEGEDGAGPAKRIRLQRVEVPASAFDESEGELASIFVNATYAGGRPAYMQGAPDTAPGKFVLQFDQELVPMNLADQGIMYVFEDTAFLQSA